MSSLSQLFHEWLFGVFGPLVLPFMLFLLWAGNRWRPLSWLTLHRKRWLLLWGCYGLVKGIALGVFVWVRFLNDSSSGILALDWPTSTIWRAFNLGYSPTALLLTTLLGAIFETAIDSALAALSWWVFQWSSSQQLQTRRMTILYGLALLIPSSLGIVARGPTILWPMPALMVIPSFLVPFGVFGFAIAVPTAFFLLWNPQLFRGEPGLPKRTYFLFACAVLLSILWFMRVWTFGVKYQGPQFMYTVCIVNGLWASFLAVLFIRAWKRPLSFNNSLALHWLLFAWLAWYAFPILGELP